MPEPPQPTGVFVGLCTLDVIHEVDAPPGPDEKVTARSQSVAAGGPATNAAVTFAALGGTAVLVTPLGRGAAADIVRADLATCRVGLVDVAPGQRDRVPISSISVATGTGARSVVSVDAGLAALDTVPSLDEVVSGKDIVLVDGHHAALALEAVRAAAGAGVPVVLDAGRWRPVMASILPHASAVICSADFRHPGTDDAASSAQAVIGAGVPTVVVTRGADPVLWWSHGRSGAVPPPRVEVVDTTAAGDVFHGAYCHRAVTTPDVVDCVTAASGVAAFKCRYPGTRSWLDSVQQIGTLPR